MAFFRYNGFYLPHFFTWATFLIPHLGLFYITSQTCQDFRNQVQKFLNILSQKSSKCSKKIISLNFPHLPICDGLEIAKSFDINNVFLMTMISFILSNLVVFMQYEMTLKSVKFHEIFDSFNVTSEEE